jgi:hypothetical protein
MRLSLVKQAVLLPAVDSEPHSLVKQAVLLRAVDSKPHSLVNRLCRYLHLIQSLCHL